MLLLETRNEVQYYINELRLIKTMATVLLVRPSASGLLKATSGWAFEARRGGAPRAVPASVARARTARRPAAVWVGYL